MAIQWYLTQGDDDLGPMTSDELKKLAADGKIGPRDLVRKEGTTRWLLASKLEGLLSTPNTTPSAPSVRTPSPITTRGAPSVETSSPGSYSPVEPPSPSDVKRAQPEPVETASPGGRGWSGSPWVWVGAGSAVLAVVVAAFWFAIPISLPVQQVANHQAFSPPIAKAAPRPARPGPVAKAAPPAVPVAVVKQNPAPAKAQMPNVATRPPSVLSSDYIQLAKLLSNIFRGDAHPTWVIDTDPRAKIVGGRMVPRNSGPSSVQGMFAILGIDAGQSNLTHPGPTKRFGSYTARPTNPVNGAPETKQLTGTIQKLKGARNPVVKEAVARLEAGHQEAIEAAKKIDEKVEAARRGLEAADGRAGAVASRAGIGSADASELDSARRELAAAADWYERLKAGAPEGKRVALYGAMETARLDCWKTIAGKLPEIYRGSLESNDLIQFRITAPDAAGKQRGEFAVANTSRQTLTNVTLVLELLPFSTAPEPSVFQAYFIPEWQAGQEIRLATRVEQNRECEAMHGRPISADPARDLGDGVPGPAAYAWLASLGGLVAVQASVWSAQAHQPVRNFPFPDQALAGASWELGVAIRASCNLTSTMMRRASPKTKFTLPADSWEVRAAQRVLTFVPPDSDLARRAHLLIDDPVQLLREENSGRPVTATPTAGAVGPGLGRPGIEALVARLVPDTVFQGKWTFRMPNGPPMRNGPLTIERRKKLAVLTNKSAPCSLQINTCNPKTLIVTATLRAANRPGAKRDFKGKIVEEQATGRVFLYFPVTATDQRREWLLDTDLDLFTAPESLTMELIGDRLIGKMPGPVRPEIYWFELECTAGGKKR